MTEEQQYQEAETRKEIGWISVTDRLPEDYVEVLITVVSKLTGKITVRGHEWWPIDKNENAGTIITHWMPLPEPPESSKVVIDG